MRFHGCKAFNKLDDAIKRDGKVLCGRVTKGKWLM